MALRVVYVDLDGTLLGRMGSLLHDHEGNFSLMAVKALQACDRAGVEVVIKSGRRKAQVLSAARLMGQRSYICEVGALLVDGDEEVWLSGPYMPSLRRTIFEQIEEQGAPGLLLSHYRGRLEHHSPWHLNRDVSHLFRGEVDVDEANSVLSEAGHSELKLIDNGATGRRSSSLKVDQVRIYHLLPKDASKKRAVEAHQRRRAFSPEQCIAVGDSPEDLAVADMVGRFFLVANAVEGEPEIMQLAASKPNVQVTDGKMGEGFYEAVVRTLAESR